MNETSLIECQVLSASHHAVVMSVFAKGLRNTALIQLLRIDTGVSHALSIFAIYREGPMTFETSAKLKLPRTGSPAEAMLRELVEDEIFLGPLVEAITMAVDRHFGRSAADARRWAETDDRSVERPRTSAPGQPAP